MKCPKCGCEYNVVINSRPTEKFNGIRRRRECEACSERFATYEYTREELTRISLAMNRPKLVTEIADAVENVLYVYIQKK